MNTYHEPATKLRFQPIDQGYSVNGPRATSGPRRPNNWPAEQWQIAQKTFLTHSTITWKLFFLTVLGSGAPLNNFLEEELYKSLNKWMDEWIYEWMNEWMNEWMVIMIACTCFLIPFLSSNVSLSKHSRQVSIFIVSSHWPHFLYT